MTKDDIKSCLMRLSTFFADKRVQCNFYIPDRRLS